MIEGSFCIFELNKVFGMFWHVAAPMQYFLYIVASAIFTSLVCVLQQLAELKKENFGLKLRIYHLEEALRSKWGIDGEGWQLVSGGEGRL